MLLVLPDLLALLVPRDLKEIRETLVHQGPQGPQGFLDATAMRNLQNDFATKLGYSSYDQMASYATQGKTIINGGLIRTNLIDATAIVVNALAAGRITTGNLTVTDGALSWRLGD